jgi:hypothetical protein
MDMTQRSAAPASGSADDDIPDFADLAVDPEIAPLLGFEPVFRKVKRPDGWTPELQRELIARIASTGTLQQAVWQMGKHATGAEGLYKTADAHSFRAAWDAALAIGRRRNGLDSRPPFAGPVPGIQRRRKPPAVAEGPPPGQVVNEYGEYEDEYSYRERGEEAKDSIAGKLLRIRRLYLREISASPGKRAAFEILTELPIDWEIAARGEPHPDEPWRRTSARNPDMVLLAESGWSFGEHGYGVDKKAEIRAAIDSHRQDQGLEPVNWSGEDEE